MGNGRHSVADLPVPAGVKGPVSPVLLFLPPTPLPPPRPPSRLGCPVSPQSIGTEGGSPARWSLPPGRGQTAENLHLPLRERRFLKRNFPPTEDGAWQKGPGSRGTSFCAGTPPGSDETWDLLPAPEAAGSHRTGQGPGSSPRSTNRAGAAGGQSLHVCISGTSVAPQPRVRLGCF